MIRVRQLLPLSFALLATALVVLSSCSGGGGGGGGGGPSGPPLIGAELVSFPSGAVPPGFTSNAFVEVLDSNDDSIPNASVTMNNVTLSYVADDQGYEGNVVVAPGDAVSLSVTVGGTTYTASATQFASYPTISTPASGAFDQHVANTMTWSGGAPTAAATTYVLGAMDAGDPNAPLVWPVDQFLHEVPLGTTSFQIPAASITGGNRLLIAGISSDTTIPNAAQGSTLSVSGFNYVSITVNGMQVTRHSLSAGLFAGGRRMVGNTIRGRGRARDHPHLTRRLQLDDTPVGDSRVPQRNSVERRAIRRGRVKLRRRGCPDFSGWCFMDIALARRD
jgi:hypothetical protein